jgi:TRAP-type C4-dicarboxylate transport system substrate-binding protein
MRLPATASGILICLGLCLAAGPSAASDNIVVVSLAPAKGIFRGAFDIFKSTVERDLPGGTNVTLLVDGQAGSEESMLSSLRRGRAQFGVLTTVGASAAMPELTLLMAPYLFDSFEQADYVLDNHVAGPAADLMAEKGLVFIQWVDSGWWNVFATRRLAVPADSRNLRMRAGGGDPALLFLKAIGADVIPLPFAEIVPGLQTGLIEGGVTNTAMYVGVGMDQYAPHLTMTRHALNPGLVMANRRWFEGLDDTQKSVLAGAFPASAVLRAGVRREEEEALDSLRERGLQAYEPTSDEIEHWRTLAKPLHQELVQRLGGRARQLYDAVVDGKSSYNQSTR